MVRSAICDDQHHSYFTNVAKQYPFTIGLIIGQSVAGKDYVVHFAKTPPHQGGEPQAAAPVLKSIADADEEWVADHARQATRMLPGGMHVLGVFLVAGEDLLSPFSAKLKGVLGRVHRTLEASKYLFGNLGDSGEKIALNYCKTSQQFTGKSYDVATGGVKPLEFRFLPSAMKWTQVECKYQMDQVYHIRGNENDWPLKKHMGIILDKVNTNLNASVYLFDGELKDGDESIDAIGKKKISRNTKANKDEAEVGRSLQICILQPCKKDEEHFEITNTQNEIRIFGHVVSKLWLNAKISINSACEALRQDIMRSLSTRLEMHWDSLTEEEHGEDMNSVHEPPRRVLIPLPNSKIAISDYLFPGEGPQDAQISLEEMLDFKISNESDVVDVEGQADVADYYHENLETESEDIIVKTKTDSNRTLFIIGLGVAILVLIISLVINFMQES